jgi:hypothetical protein
MRGPAQHDADILKRIGGVHLKVGIQLFQRIARIGHCSAADYASNIEHLGKQRAPHRSFPQ